jgi:predicted branched-subunit amino acid permease
MMMERKEDSTQTLLWRGFLAMLPLWSGAIPTGAAYALAARSSGMSPFDVQLASLSIFSAAAQIGALSLGTSASYVEYALVGLTTNLQLIVLGFAAGQASPFGLRYRHLLAVAILLTDATFAVAMREGTLRWQVLVGAGAGMYAGWNAGTALGLLSGAALPREADASLRLVLPLVFIAITVPLVRSNAQVAAAAAAGATCLVLRSEPAGVMLAAAALIGCAVGNWTERRASTDRRAAISRASR